MKIKIADGLSLPIDIVTQVEVIIAKRRAGKSYTMRRLTEQLLEQNQQIILVDPKGDQWGLRSSADGKKPGFPVLILGGEHGDLPLEASSGELVARLAVEERVSILIDLSQFRKHEIATFMTAFLENLYRLKAQEKYRTPVKLIVDEADAIAPQKPQKGEERMLGAIEDIVRRGGQRGIGCTLVTQRSAVLNKNVLTQAQMLVVLRTIAPQDIAAMKAWIDVHGTIEQGRTLIDSLPSLPIGDAWFWSPGWPTEVGIFKRSHVFPITTFDSGATPKPGVKQIVPKNLADVDLESLKGQMSATIEKAKNDNPKYLKSEIARLTKELSTKKQDVNTLPTAMGVSQWLEYGKKHKYYEYFVAKINQENAREMKKFVDNWKKSVNAITVCLSESTELFFEIDHLIEETSFKAPDAVSPARNESPRHKEQAKPPQPQPDALASGAMQLSNPERRVLNAVVLAETIISNPSNSLVAFLSGYSNPKSAGYTNPRGFLKENGLVVYNVSGTVSSTKYGREQAQHPDEVLTREELHKKILSLLTNPQARILKPLLEMEGEYISNQDLAGSAGYTNHKSAGYTNPRSNLKSFGLIEYGKDCVKASDILFI